MGFLPARFAAAPGAGRQNLFRAQPSRLRRARTARFFHKPRRERRARTNLFRERAALLSRTLLAIVTRRKRNVGQCIAAQHRVRLIGSLRSTIKKTVRLKILRSALTYCYSHVKTAFFQPFKK